MKHVLSDWDLSPEQVTQILHISEKIKSKPSLYKHTLEGKTLIMLFELASLRTRISFEAGMTQLGGHAIMYGVENQGFSRSETLKDGVAVLARYGDIIMARVLKHDSMVEMGEASTVPVINGMTELYHPCQNLADLLTIKEKKGKPPPTITDRPRRLSFKEQQELAALPPRIEELETEQAALHGKLADPRLYQDVPGQVADLRRRLDALEAELPGLYARWEELEELSRR